MHHTPTGVGLVSQAGEYALRAVVRLAVAGGGPLSTRELAGATRAPAGYLSKALRSLVEAGVLRARRGVGGGFSLARPAGEITVLEVLRAAGGSPIAARPPCAALRGRTLERILVDALDQVHRSLDGTTIEDLALSEERHGDRIPLDQGIF